MAANEYDTCRHFLNSRHNWIDVQVVPGTFGGWDVVLRIDGTYSDRGDAEMMAEHFMEFLLSLKDFDTTRLDRVAYMNSPEAKARIRQLSGERG